MFEGPRIAKFSKFTLFYESLRLESHGPWEALKASVIRGES
jgi:hypothetical protein